MKNLNDYLKFNVGLSSSHLRNLEYYFLRIIIIYSNPEWPDYEIYTLKGRLERIESLKLLQELMESLRNSEGHKLQLGSMKTTPLLNKYY